MSKLHNFVRSIIICCILWNRCTSPNDSDYGFSELPPQRQGAIKEVDEVMVLEDLLMSCDPGQCHQAVI